MLDMTSMHGQQGKEVPVEDTDLIAVRQSSADFRFDHWSSDLKVERYPQEVSREQCP